MTSRAHEWARRLADARTVADAVERERPVSPPEVYVTGFGKMAFAVSDEGRPVLVLSGDAHEITFADDVVKLRAQARWILDTFGEPVC